jgi:hypothetical protein
MEIFGYFHSLSVVGIMLSYDGLVRLRHIFEWVVNLDFLWVLH